MASRVSVKRLNSVDFPTLGLPMIATTFAISFSLLVYWRSAPTAEKSAGKDAKF